LGSIPRFAAVKTGAPTLSQELSLASGTGAQPLNPNKQLVVAFINEMDAEKKTPYDGVHFPPKILDLSLVIRQSERWPQSICWLAINRTIAASCKISDDASRHGEQPTIKLFVADVRRIAFGLVSEQGCDVFSCAS
jgi:hypothetical protein